MTYPIFSSRRSDGSFGAYHKTALSLDGGNGFKAIKTACGRGPMDIQNVFPSIEAADGHCGGRFERYACKTCFPPEH
jgi:hypothetical protein